MGLFKPDAIPQLGRADKIVRCDECNAEYRYTLFRLTRGGAANLQGALDRETDPVPCPACGYFHPDMVREARRRKLPWLNRVALWGLATFPVWGLILAASNVTFLENEPVLPWRTFLLVLLGGVAFFLLLPLIRLALVARYDPGREDPDDLFRLGYCGGVLVKDSQGNSVVRPQPNLDADIMLAAADISYISCEECGQEYQSFSGMAPASLNGVAPCPRCGRIQKFMFAAARAKWRGQWAGSPKRFMAIGAASFLAALLLLPATIMLQTDHTGHSLGHLGFEDVSAESLTATKILFWTVEVSLLVAGVLLLVTGWVRNRTYDPNVKSRERRLALAQLLSKTREEIEAAQGSGPEPAPRN